ncbi:YdaS family helix-turn-helix protein [Rhizobium leguminosarum]
MERPTGMDAVRERMPLSWLARKIGVSRGAVAQWKNVPAERMRDVSEATGIPMEILRPDIFESKSESAA